MSKPKPVAAIITEYRRHSHADVIVGKLLEGYNYQGRDFPQLRLASMYIDQFPKNDLSRELSKKFNVPIYDSIEDALTLRTNRIRVDGVLSIGEHGNYPFNDIGQKLYPRRRFFEAIANAFAKHRRAVPVFNDKHLATSWEDARWMYDRARELSVPFMAGSSVPITWRRPQLQFAQNTPLEEAVQIGYGDIEGYGFHALEGMQCLAEFRRGGETGVRSVQWLSATEMWQALDAGRWSGTLLEAAMALVPAHANMDHRKATSKARDAGAFIIEYRDGFKATIAMLNGWVYEGDGGAFIAAFRVRDRDKPQAVQFYLQNDDPFGHFAHQIRAVENMVQTGHASYPVERTLLTTGILEAAMQSRHDKGRRVDTKHLDIRYEAVNWPFARDPVPPRIKR